MESREEYIRKVQDKFIKYGKKLNIGYAFTPDRKKMWPSLIQKTEKHLPTRYEIEASKMLQRMNDPKVPEFEKIQISKNPLYLMGYAHKIAEERTKEKNKRAMDEELAAMEAIQELSKPASDGEGQEAIKSKKYLGEALKKHFKKVSPRT